jgi:hypothetical protein
LTTLRNFTVRSSDRMKLKEQDGSWHNSLYSDRTENISGAARLVGSTGWIIELRTFFLMIGAEWSWRNLELRSSPAGIPRVFM